MIRRPSPLAASIVVLSSLVVGTLVACGGVASVAEGDRSCGNGLSGSACPDGGSGTTTGTDAATEAASDVVVSGRVPKKHRATAQACDATRPTTEPANIPDGGGFGDGYITCRSNAECTAGTNGRCNGNSHDGWRCTYDACSADGDCGGGTGVCECEGAFRADANVCLGEGNCRVDADCGGAGFCSPTLGSCGHYGKTSGYFCHTPSDECLDDEDCAGQGQAGETPYCAYDKNVGRWKCSTSECAG